MRNTEHKLTLFLTFINVIVCTLGTGSNPKYYSSKYGVRCNEECDTHGKSYLWCMTAKGWDYCSTKENVDYTGQPCREDHPCGKYGKGYHWCYTNSGSWGYCGILRNASEPKTLLYKGSSTMSLCWSDCLYDENKQYFWCYTEKGWDYCSPLPEVTYKNEPCRLDHYCDPHEYAYTWCLTNSGNDYCGSIEPGECQYVNSVAAKENSKTVVSCIWKDTKNNKEIKLTAEPDFTIFAEAFTWKNEIINFIARWKNTYLNPEPGSKLIISNNLRFDVKKLENEEEQQIYSLQILVNVHTQSWRSNKLAQVVLPDYEEVPERFVQLAFLESFRHQSKISVVINESSTDKQ
ncbi:uncharacterized protein LOC124381090 [Silurus meridionalis]|uniref:uncharacterized protein LOC124381090 n=1 Tax=Silurus meridionalis TaxID=175797 RepID=UPI001EEC1EA4|nr:uncharacterized protein LOC124381090 [Silurus meridionalis]